MRFCLHKAAGVLSVTAKMVGTCETVALHDSLSTTTTKLEWSAASCASSVTNYSGWQMTIQKFYAQQSCILNT